jgi:hypothetical protein
MSDETKKEVQKAPEESMTGPASAPRDPDELTDAELNSVAGGFVSMHIDAYSGTNFLEA